MASKTYKWNDEKLEENFYSLKHINNADFLL